MKCAKSALPLLLLLGLLAPPAGALESDAKQPIYIEADTATYDEAKGETVYIGNVRTTQGSLEVFGDRMIVLQKNGKTEKIISYGNPTRIKQTPEPGEADWHGTGQRAEYFPDTGILILYDNALAWRGDHPDGSDRVASDRIEYDSRRSVMKAGVPSGGTGKRVRVTMQPQEGTSE
jgi:lipopolysaccharide export system protein LptA